IENPTCWIVQDVDPLDSYVGTRILLLGDAAHAVMPRPGTGTSQAMEDACILGAIIPAIACKHEDVPPILQTYDVIQRPFCSWIVQTAQ
ncbi:hypothetical protein L218DRAFT_819445, partial [Marasmius fiardii PR-910]